MAWRIVCELLLLSKFVSLSVIPESRRLQEASRTMEASEGDTEARAKRSLHYLSSEEEDESVWEAVCPTVEHRRPVVPMEDDQVRYNENNVIIIHYK